MPNIGDTLEEARKRQGISIREAAEGTKVRSDFLTNFENNQFDFDLPEVYKRGFLKIYARYLKLDTEKLMTDYNAVLLGNSKVSNKRESREFLGRMDLPDETKTLGSTESQPPFGEHSAKVAQTSKLKERPSTPSDGPADPMEQKTDSSLYWKIGGIVAATFILVGLLAVLVNVLISPSEPEDVASGQQQPVQSVVSDSNNPDAAAPATNNGNVEGAGQITIIADGDTSVIVRQENNNEKLFSGALAAGDSVTIDRVGIVRVISPEIQNVTVEINGKTYKSNQTGLRQLFFDPSGPTSSPQN